MMQRIREMKYLWQSFAWVSVGVATFLVSVGCEYKTVDTKVEEMLAFSVCNEGDPEDVLVPLQVGNHWRYAFEYHNREGALVTQSDSNYFAVVGTVPVSADAFWFRVRYYDESVDPPREAMRYYRNCSSGFCDWGWSPYSTEDFFMYPAGAGDRYPLGIDSARWFEVVSLDTAIVVPAGAFRCILYRAKGVFNNLTYDCYMTPGVGRIRHDIVDNQSQRRWSWQLLSYQVGG
jgi:hypothetical protein